MFIEFFHTIGLKTRYETIIYTISTFKRTYSLTNIDNCIINPSEFGNYAAVANVNTLNRRTGRIETIKSIPLVEIHDVYRM